MRPAELLVLNDLYDTTRRSARAALDGMGSRWPRHWVGVSSRATRRSPEAGEVMVGKTSGKKSPGRLIPGFAIAYNSVANRRDTNRWPSARSSSTAAA